MEPRFPSLQVDSFPAEPQGKPCYSTSCELIRLNLEATFVQLLSLVQLFVTPWTVARQAPLSMGFSRHEYWSGLPFPPPGDLPNPGFEPESLAIPAGGLFTTVDRGAWQATVHGVAKS